MYRYNVNGIFVDDRYVGTYIRKCYIDIKSPKMLFFNRKFTRIDLEYLLEVSFNKCRQNVCLEYSFFAGCPGFAGCAGISFIRVVIVV